MATSDYPEITQEEFEDMCAQMYGRREVTFMELREAMWERIRCCQELEMKVAELAKAREDERAATTEYEKHIVARILHERSAPERAARDKRLNEETLALMTAPKVRPTDPAKLAAGLGRVHLFDLRKAAVGGCVSAHMHEYPELVEIVGKWESKITQLGRQVLAEMENAPGAY